MTRFHAGDPCPDFNVTDLEGRPVSSSTETPVFLGLYRFAACPFCSMRVHQLISRQQEIQDAGLDLVVVFPSSEKRIHKYVSRYKPSFRLVSDPEESLYALFHAETSWKGELRTALNLPKVARALFRHPNSPLAADGPVHRMPSEFLIANKTIQLAFYGRALDDGVDLDTLLTTHKSLA